MGRRLQRLIQQHVVKQLSPLVQVGRNHHVRMCVRAPEHGPQLVGKLLPCTLCGRQDEEGRGGGKGREGGEEGHLEGLGGHIPPAVNSWQVKDGWGHSGGFSKYLGNRVTKQFNGSHATPITSC